MKTRIPAWLRWSVVLGLVAVGLGQVVADWAWPNPLVTTNLRALYPGYSRCFIQGLPGREYRERDYLLIPHSVARPLLVSVRLQEGGVPAFKTEGWRLFPAVSLELALFCAVVFKLGKVVAKMLFTAKQSGRAA